MRRGVGIVLVGLGVFFVALALLLRFYVVPSLLVTPIDQFAESFAPGTGTVFNPATLVEEDNVDMVAHRTLRTTGEAVHCCGEAVDGVPTRHEGLSYKFPFGTEKKTYQFFDTTAKKAYPMTYKGSDQIQGLTRDDLDVAWEYAATHPEEIEQTIRENEAA